MKTIILWTVCMFPISSAITVEMQETKELTEAEIERIWNLFTETCNKSYTDSVQASFRKDIVMENAAKVLSANYDYFLNKSTFQTALNCRSDLTKTEDKLLSQGYNTAYIKAGPVIPSNPNPPSKSFDWRDRGVTQDSDNQGILCPCSWAKAATIAVEIAYYIKTGTILRLSEQELVDCSHDFGNAGCDGGRIDSAYSYMMKHGISSEEDYPFIYSAGTCKRETTPRSPVILKGYMNSREGNVTELMRNIEDYGPFSVAMDTNCWNFRHYKTGVLNCDEICSAYDVTMGFVCLGYGEENNLYYWNLLAPFGNGWGENGYVRILMNNNHCGVATDALVPILKDY